MVVRRGVGCALLVQCGGDWESVCVLLPAVRVVSLSMIFFVFLSVYVSTFSLLFSLFVLFGKMSGNHREHTSNK